MQVTHRPRLATAPHTFLAACPAGSADPLSLYCVAADDIAMQRTLSTSGGKLASGRKSTARTRTARATPPATASGPFHGTGSHAAAVAFPSSLDSPLRAVTQCLPHPSQVPTPRWSSSVRPHSACRLSPGRRTACERPRRRSCGASGQGCRGQVCPSSPPPPPPVCSSSPLVATAVAKTQVHAAAPTAVDRSEAGRGPGRRMPQPRAPRLSLHRDGVHPPLTPGA